MAGKKTIYIKKPVVSLLVDIYRLSIKTLSLIGRPFYFILRSIFILAISLCFLLGQVISKTIKTFLSIKIPRPEIKIPGPKIKIPKRKEKKLSVKRNRTGIKFIPVFVFVVLATFFFYFLVLKGLPSPKELVTRDQDVSTKIYDRNGILLYTIYKDKNRTPVTLDMIPAQVILATLAAEDAEFYSHPGFSLRGIGRAITKNVKNNKLTGGSTITQQLVKNALLSSEKTFIRKIRELILSVEVEANFSKDQILEMYLNEVSYGGTAYGIQEASRYYFGKDVNTLNTAEAALLAGLPQSPSKYSPFGPNPELAFSRQREVIHLMKVNKYITQEEENEALSTPLSFTANRTKILAPHFVMYVRERLIEMYGEEVVAKGGLSVTTTLDYQIQLLAEKSINEELDRLKNFSVGNAAVLVIDPVTNEILAMVGSRDYFDVATGGNVNVTTRPRQPGSSIKVVNYAQALTNGLTLASTIDDSPISFSVPGLPVYTPKNYDGTYRGKITVRQALAESRNIPAVKILASYGVDKMIDLGQKMGITTWDDRSRFGLSLTLGGGEVTLIDLAHVYSVVADYGKNKEIASLLNITNYKEKEIFTKGKLENIQTVLDPRVAFLLIDVLKDNTARTPAFGANSSLVIPGHPEVAVKTGTSNNLRDNLTVGFNQKYLVAVWVGNNDNSPMSRIASGITGAAPIWNRIMRTLLYEEPSVPWDVPEGLINKQCYSRKEWFLEEKQISCPKIIEPALSTSL